MRAHPSKDEQSADMARLHALPDLWLGAALVRMARELRSSLGDEAGNPFRDDPVTDFLWQVVPEVARRLGLKGLLPNEGTRLGLRGERSEVIRRAVGLCLAGGAERISAGAAKGALGILWRDPGRGNPCVIGLDRIAPPPPPRPVPEDWIALRVAAAARAAGHGETTSWCPALSFPVPRQSASVLRPSFGSRGDMPREHPAPPDPGS